MNFGMGISPMPRQADHARAARDGDVYAARNQPAPTEGTRGAVRSVRACTPNGRKSTKMEMAKNGTISSWELHFPLSGSPPGGERAGLSRGGEGTTVRPTRTSPRRAPHPWGQGRAAGPAGHPRKVCTDQPLCGANAYHDGGDRSGPLGMWAPLLGSMQN